MGTRSRSNGGGGARGTGSPSPSPTLKPHDLALLYNVTPHTIRNWCHSGRFPNAYRAGKSWRVPRSDLPPIYLDSK